jgi:hypothetical protein
MWLKPREEIMFHKFYFQTEQVELIVKALKLADIGDKLDNKDLRQIAAIMHNIKFQDLNDI